MLSGILYPYQNSFIRENLDRQNNYKFGLEFINFLDNFLHSILMSSGQLDTQSSRFFKSSRNTKSSRIKSGKSNLVSSQDSFDCIEILSLGEMKNVIELLCLYTDVNTKVIEDKKNKDQCFNVFTNTLKSIISVLKQIKLEISENDQTYLRQCNRDPQFDGDINLFSYFDIQNRMEADNSTHHNAAVKVLVGDTNLGLPTLEKNEV